MQTIDATCKNADGLKWFNWLYLQVTQAVGARVKAGGFAAPMARSTDLHFALYFSALKSSLSGAPCSYCWAAVFGCRNNVRIARIQFALSGVNAHINHNLPEAIVSTCKVTNTVPQHGIPQYYDYTAVNSTLDTVIDTAGFVAKTRALIC